MFKTLLRDPLLHFAVLGALIYWLMNSLSPSANSLDSQTIQITENDLVTYLQNRDQVFDAELYRQKLAAYTAEQRELAESQYVQQEVLFREAKKLGLDQNDQLLRRRLIQKIKYFLEGLSSASTVIEPNQVDEHYAAQQQDYLTPAKVSFTHVFFKAENANDQSALDHAKLALNNHSSKQAELSTSMSDHFPYHRHYADKSEAQIARHFGSEFAKQLFSLNTQADQWQGPIESAYGQHLLMINKKTAANVPPLSDIRERVSQDLQRKVYAQALQKQIDQLVGQYKVVAE